MNGILTLTEAACSAAKKAISRATGFAMASKMRMAIIKRTQSLTKKGAGAKQGRIAAGINNAIQTKASLLLTGLFAIDTHILPR